MKRTDITSLFPEATDDQINALMSINGNDINNAKKGIEELQTSLKDAQTKLASVENNSAALQEAIDRANGLQTELDTMKAAEQVRQTREDVAKSVGVPAHLLTGDTKEACEAQAQAILEYARPSTYPSVPDGGEPVGTVKKATRDQFAEHFNQIL
jgi:DNA repair exonuclease SbcCD ATPase subunit